MSAERSDDTLWRREQQADDDMQTFVERRALIEQAKGMLMFGYGIDADDACKILRWQSQEHNIKLRLIAEQILKDLVQVSQSKGPARRVSFDGLMLTAYMRIAHVAARQMDGQSKTDD
jgi:hypothetical protein